MSRLLRATFYTKVHSDEMLPTSDAWRMRCQLAFEVKKKKISEENNINSHAQNSSSTKSYLSCALQLGAGPAYLPILPTILEWRPTIIHRTCLHDRGWRGGVFAADFKRCFLCFEQLGLDTFSFKLSRQKITEQFPRFYLLLKTYKCRINMLFFERKWIKLNKMK